MPTNYCPGDDAWLRLRPSSCDFFLPDRQIDRYYRKYATKMAMAMAMVMGNEFIGGQTFLQYQGKFPSQISAFSSHEPLGWLL